MTKIPIKIIVFVGFIILLLLQAIILKPIIKEHYLTDDIKNFMKFSWKYTIYVFVAVVLVMLLISRKDIKISHTPQIILFFVILGLGFYLGIHNSIDNTLLYLNLKAKNNEIVKTYKVINHKENQTFWLDSKESIHDRKDMEIIDKNRIKHNLKSIFEYQTGDTIKVKFNYGIMGINYLD